MGQYFHFEHENGEVNKKGIPSNRGLYWFSNLNNYCIASIREVFEEVACINDWPQGMMWAYGDDGVVISYNAFDKVVIIEDGCYDSDDRF